ncbi:TetR family transcriptional regulator [Vibrio breoganii]|uniref:TetR/AcrR family transcriptional regulator n=1 Tax=Vibrio breoganii TaxID=553239 RepID=UPI000C842ACE|nr:TetR/AcrR family transcriptional regulator [Vibrio breoganii]PMG88346.1 TetR family transcriptional regulator [Vibrio breoganii]PML90485.1 TetR family transcriptional regulator [Vibrio breoganii]PMP01082.1 TetR family transcriptional regulator [Vibrio breoganii]TKG29297.1 TetR/AcrR family transcriptional regulator [Vibrio breoganii]
MSKVEQNREKKKQAILVAAKNAFLSEGYTAASMDSIAAEAKITKQTLYRYYPSKFNLFQSTLAKLGEGFSERYLQHLSQKDTHDALIAFAKEFMQFHLSGEHIATQRLLIAEVNQSPEIIESFMEMSSDSTSSALHAFFAERFELVDPETKIDLWLGMLLAPRAKALLGMPILNSEQIEKHAIEATKLLLAGI